MYAILGGAKKNVGDALIIERCTALIRHIKPRQELKLTPSWEPLDPELCRTADALIIPGGPGYKPNLYPRTYPLTPDFVEHQRVPLFAVGLGWKGIPGDLRSMRTYRFDERSMRLLSKLDAQGTLSCRDDLTLDVLRRHGLQNAVMTGCPVWYDIPSLGKPMRIARVPEKIVFTPPQVEVFADQSIHVARVLRELFPSAKLICSFHRGIAEPGEWTSKAEIDSNSRIASAARDLGYDVVDVSGKVDNLDFYATCDLHVGYRVHAHIYFLSKRLPSLLLHEDGRGIGASDALGVRGIDAFERNMSGVLLHSMQETNAITRRVAKAARRIGAREYDAPNDVALAVRAQLHSDVADGFARYAGVAARIDAQFEVMKRFLERLPDAHL
jgi:Polysaccharide pyruvyl transferase